VYNFIPAAKSYVSMKSLSESRVSLDIRLINARLLYVSREETIIRLVGFVQPRISVPGLFR
jgi:hypothetical protein